jgi:hypothetical protein
MKKVNSFTYDVVPGEQIRITVTPTNFGSSLPDVEAVLDGDDLPNTNNNDAPVFEFTVSKPVGKTHRVLMEFVFLSDAPGTAFYEVVISGQDDVGCPCGFVISKANQVKEVGIRFRVKTAQ